MIVFLPLTIRRINQILAVLFLSGKDSYLMSHSFIRFIVFTLALKSKQLTNNFIADISQQQTKPWHIPFNGVFKYCNYFFGFGWIAVFGSSFESHVKNCTAYALTTPRKARILSKKNILFNLFY